VERGYICKRLDHFFILPIFDAIRAFSIFFRKWANLVAGLCAIYEMFNAKRAINDGLNDLRV
jgi:hypothetical protein